MNTHSLHEFLQIAETRIVKAAIAKEDLSSDLSLFMRNIRLGSQPQGLGGDILDQSKTVLELQTQGNDFHTVFNSFDIVHNQKHEILVNSIA